MVKAVHTSVPGRGRFKVSGLYRSLALKEFLESALSENGFIRWISADILTGNVLVRFDPHQSHALVASLLQRTATEFSRARNVGERPSSVLPDSENRPSPPGEATAWNSIGRPIVERITRLLGTGEEQRDETWHCLPSGAVLASFGTLRESGLTSDQAGKHLNRFGPNLLPESESRSRFSIFVDQFKSLPVFLLGAAAGISLVTGGLADAVVILSVVALNGVIGFVTENQSESIIQSLKRLIRPAAEVIRDSRVVRVSAEELVPGDLLILKPGTSVGADCRLIEASHLTLDESVLTGESMPVVKNPDALPRPGISLADRVNMVYMGTLVTGGYGMAVVVATGRYTEVGRLQTLVCEAESPETPMERQLSRLGDQLVLISSAACGIVFAVGLLQGYGLLQMFKTAISLAIAAVPEGLPAVATTTLALGIRKMRQHKVLIRKLEAVETLGCVQTICFDKTGTITLNRMSVLRVFAGMRRFDFIKGSFCSGEGVVDPLSCLELLRLMETVVLCNETEVFQEDSALVLRGSPTENALVQMAIDCSLDVVGLRSEYPRLKTNYRSENRLFMGTLHCGKDGNCFVALKGSPTEVLAMCDRQIREEVEAPLSEDDRLQIEFQNEQMAGEALRVLGVACAMGEGEERFGSEEGFTWLGLVGMADPVRPGVRELVGRFHSAGIDTVMITGDQSATAYAIGKDLDLSSGEQLEILDSTDLAMMDPELIRALSEKVHVFSRVSPAHKLQIVRALQSAGRTVAMTGDGINDGPALKAADIGIAMGEGGTDIAREVADVILEEDNLETMIIAVTDGRAIYNNIRKALHFLLATNFSEIIVMLLTLAAGIRSPLNAMQLLWINLLSDIFPGLALAMEEPEPDILEKPPRPPHEPIVKTADFKRLGFESGVISLSALGAYALGVMRYGMGPQAGTIAFQSLTSAQLLHALSCRSETRSLFDKEPLPPNRNLSIALAGSFFLQTLTLLIPGLRTLLGTTPIGIADGFIIGASAALPLVINEATKKHNT